MGVSEVSRGPCLGLSYRSLIVHNGNGVAVLRVLTWMRALGGASLAKECWGVCEVSFSMLEKLRKEWTDQSRPRLLESPPF